MNSLTLVSEGIRFALLKNGDRIVGFELTASNNNDSEAFCKSFLDTKVAGKAWIKVVDNELHFEHGGTDRGVVSMGMNSHRGGVFVAKLGPGEAQLISQLMHHQGEYKGTTFRTSAVNAPGRGFQVKLQERSPYV